MAPPGRRKLPLAVLLPLLILVLFSVNASAASAVLGIDLGTEYLKAAVAKPGSPIDVVLTKDSKRKEAATLAFKPSRAQKTDPEAFPERLYGGDAIALSARYPSDVFPNLKSLLGLARYSEPAQQYAARHPGLSLVSVQRFEDGNARGTVGFKSTNIGDEKDAFMVEELLAMELKNIKANAEAAVGKGSVVTDAVITYPVFYTAEEKRAVELAADLAGLRLLGMVSDGLAVGLNYATTRTFESVSDGAKPEHHLVYDMGAGSTTATVLKFQGRTIKDGAKRNKTIQEVQVLGAGYDKTLGGDILNDVIVKDMINQFVETDGMKKLGLEPSHVKTHAKTMARLWKEAGRVRQVLSANPSTSASLDGIYYDDAKFTYRLSRDHFEKLVKSHANRVTSPIKEALDFAGITLEELDSIILHGGAVRTPFVQKQLEILAGGSNKIKTNVNADEAAVMGATFKAAGLSANFRVKDIRATDLAGTTFNLKWTAHGKDKLQKLFTPSSQVGIEKQVLVKALEDVTFEFSQMDAAGDKSLAITQVEASNLTKSAAELTSKHGCAPANISTIFNMRLNPANGLPEITSGSVSCKAESGKAGVMENVKGMFGFGSKHDSAQEIIEAGEENPATMAPLPVDNPTSSGSAVSEATATESSTSSSSISTKSTKSSATTPTTVTIPLALKKTSVGLNKPPTSSLPRIRQRLIQFDSSDRNTVLRSEALNTLEAYTYRARDYLTEESFIAVSTEKAREELDEALSSASDWLYGDGVDAKLQDFKDKLKGLKALVDPVLKRKQEGSGRDTAVKTLRDGLENMLSIIKMIEGSIEKSAQDAAASLRSATPSVAETVSTDAAAPSAEADDLDEDPYSTSLAGADSTEKPEVPITKLYEYTQDDLSLVTKMYDSVLSWLTEKLALQEKLSAYDEPAILVSELEMKAKELQQSVSDVVMKTIKMQELPKRGGKAKSGAKKSKTKKVKGASSSANGSASSTTVLSPTSTVSKKDEL